MSKKVWVVSMVDRGGLPHSTIASNRDDAVSAFMVQAYMFLHSFPEAAFRIVGDDNDATLSDLHCLMQLEQERLCVVSMTSPGIVGPQPDSPTHCWGDAPVRFVQIAADIEAAVANHQSAISAEERKRLSCSSVAVFFPRNGAEALIEGAQEDDEPADKFSADRAAQVWNAMGQVRQFVYLTATER